MPVPVYLLFSNELLAQQGVSFTRGRLLPSTEIGHTAEFLRGTKFLEEVYHEGGVGQRFGPNRQGHILNARHSEVIVEDELDLTYLRHIVCRSAPERETLVNLLDPAVARKWRDKMHVETVKKLFCKRGTFVQVAKLEPSSVSFTFYIQMLSQDWRGPFALRVECQTEGSSWKGGAHVNPSYSVSKDSLDIPLPQPESKYSIRITLNGDLAYLGRFDGDKPPSVLK
jgi:hypothetical protein